MNTDEAKAVIEAALLSAPQPLSIVDLRRLFEDTLPPETIRALLDDLGHAWQGRSLRLVELASGWRFQTAPEFSRFLDRLHGEKPPRYSRAVMETLAIIAYRQPATRGDIEEIRGVMVSAQIVRTLEERGWIEIIGHKDTVGRPALFGTTKKFLEDMGLRSISQLPALDGAAPPEVPAQQIIDFDGSTVGDVRGADEAGSNESPDPVASGPTDSDESGPVAAGFDPEPIHSAQSAVASDEPEAIDADPATEVERETPSPELSHENKGDRP